MSNSTQIPKKNFLAIEKQSEEESNIDSNDNIISKIDIESLEKKNAKNNLSIYKFIYLDFVYIKRKKYAMYNSEVKRRCIELVK
jgi:hypothetical protein